MGKGLRATVRNSRYLTPLALLIASALLPLVACDMGAAQKYSHTHAERFAVPNAPTLTIGNRYGDVTVRACDEDEVTVVATKRAGREVDLERINVEIPQKDGGLGIETDIPSDLLNFAVGFEITTPPDTQVDLRTDGGSVKANTGAGEIEIRVPAGSIPAGGTSGSDCLPA